MPVAAERVEPWKVRLHIPNYRVSEVARYARVSSQTIYNWHSTERGAPLLNKKEPGEAAVSYLQLIEIAVVAAFRSKGVSLASVREAREYIKKQLHSEYPFADYKFKTDGKSLLMDYIQVDKAKGRGKLLELNKRLQGQLAWSEILDARLREFDYDKKEQMVLRWHVAGEGSPIVIDPRISFGAPTVRGTPTWILKDRWVAGEELEEIAGDFRLKPEFVIQALEFENVNVKAKRPWVN